MPDPSPTATTAVARRAKKREQDRHCQRMARERTKNRIAYLEGMVADLKQQGTTRQVQALWKQRDEIAAERDALAHTLRAIEKAMDRGRKALPTTGDAAVISPQHQHTLLSDVLGDVDVDVDAINAMPVPPMFTAWPELVHNARSDAQDQADFNYTIKPVSFTPDSAAPSELEVITTNMEWLEEGQSLCTSRQDAIVPSPVASCDCSPTPAALSDPHHRVINLWRFANETLTESVEQSALVNVREDELEDDTPIRVMIDGWDAVEHRAGGSLPPSWQKLRRINETLFSTCAKTERLAILRVMHSLFRYHQDPSPERLSSLPQWYRARPSQNIAHSYAIDYFAWPGLRERFVFHQHHYCSNRFWHRFSSDLRILWPFEFRDCYSRNIHTGQYKISPGFQETTKDIRAWTMSADSFETWPEFLSDIPVYNSIPPVPLLRRLSLQQHESSSNDWSLVTTLTMKSFQIDAEGTVPQDINEQDKQQAISHAMSGSESLADDSLQHFDDNCGDVFFSSTATGYQVDINSF